MNAIVESIVASAGAVFDVERVVAQVVEKLVANDAKFLARALIKLVRFARRDELIAADGSGDVNPVIPTGPFSVDQTHDCALLVYVPRNLKSHLIDDATGAYGYSHVAIDCGESDRETGKRVMTESTTEDVVRRSFQDKYGQRPFVRIPLRYVSVDCKAFRECVNSKLGEQYDATEALTWGALDNPAKQICSDLAADCLPNALRADVAHKRMSRKLQRHAVSVHRRVGRVFISPNGFCEYFGAPRGERITRPDQLFVPQRRRAKSFPSVALIPLIVLTMACSVVIGMLIGRWFAERRAD